MSDETPATPSNQPKPGEPTETGDVVFVEPATPVETADHVEAVEPTEPPALVEPPERAETLETVDTVEPVEVVAVPATVAAVNNTEVLAPETALPPAPTPTVYVEAPVPPRKRGNRGFGVLIAVLATIVFAAVLALVLAIIDAAKGLAFGFDFVTQADFYFPVGFFLVGFILLVLIVNRGAWWAYILGSIFVALFVYFGFVGAELLNHSVFGMTPSEAGRATAALLANPTVIAAALIAREVSMWTGSAISARGRRVKARNIEARRAHEAELEAKSAEYRQPVATA